MYATLFYELTNQLAEYTGPQYKDGLPVQTWNTTYSARQVMYSTCNISMTRARLTIFCRGNTVSINIMTVCILP